MAVERDEITRGEREYYSDYQTQQEGHPSPEPILVNLFLLTNATSASFDLGLRYYHQAAVISSVSFSMLLFCICCIIHARWAYKRLHGFGSTDTFVHHYMRSPAGFSPSHVYGTERDQHQLDLNVEKSDDNSSAVLREREPLLFNS